MINSQQRFSRCWQYYLKGPQAPLLTPIISTYSVTSNNYHFIECLLCITPLIRTLHIVLFHFPNKYEEGVITPI